MRSYTEALRYDKAEEQQATAIHKALAKQDKVIDCEKLRREVIAKLGKERIYEN